MKIKEETRIKKQADEDRARAEGKLEGEAIGIQKGEVIGIQKGELKKGIVSGLLMLEKGIDTKLIQEISQFSHTQMQILIDSWKNKLSVEEILEKYGKWNLLNHIHLSKT